MSRGEKERRTSRQERYKRAKIQQPQLGTVRRVLLYLAALAFSVLSLLQAGYSILPQPAGVMIYILAAGTLSGACAYLYRDLRYGAVKKLLDILKEKPLGARFLEDYKFRTILTTLLGFLLNVAYTIYNGVLGIVSASPWFITMAVYNGLLMVMRYQAVSTQRRISQMKDPEQIQKKQLAVLRTDGILLLVLNLALSGVVLLTIAKDAAKRYSDVIVITIAAYTFLKVTMAVINMVKVRSMNSPILTVIRNVGVANALVSILTLQTTMLASFQEGSSLDANLMNAITGLGVSILIAVIGIRMIYQASKKKGHGEP